MSKETMQHLNTNVLVGDTDIRGTAWHYRAEEQGEQSNHYPGAIPVGDVVERLFHWKAVEGTVSTTYMTDEGPRTIVDETRKTIIRPDTADVLGVFKQGYQIHDYQTWLIHNVQDLLSTDLHIGSAGLLRRGGVAWVQINMGETMKACDFEYLPFLSAAGSLDGSLSSTYQTGVQAWVCDNTMAAGLAEDTPRVKKKSSKNSLTEQNIESVREALGIIINTGDTMAAQIEALAAKKVSEARFLKFADAYVGLDKEKLSKRSITIGQNKKAQLVNLWEHDERVNPWRGSAFGVLQAANTFEHHFATVKRVSRADRNAERVVFGKVAEMDAHALQVLASV